MKKDKSHLSIEQITKAFRETYLPGNVSKTQKKKSSSISYGQNNCSNTMPTICSLPIWTFNRD